MPPTGQARRQVLPPVASDQQIDEYRQNGLLRIDLRDLVGENGFSRLRDTFLRAEADGYRGHPGSDPYPAVMLYREMHRHYPEMAEVALSPRVGEFAARLMGVDHVRLWGDEVFTKRPGMPFTPWHQDAATLPFDRTDFLTIWIAIDDLGPDMGTMRYLPRSHARGLLLTTRSVAIKAGQVDEPDDVRELLSSVDLDLAEGRIDAPLRAGEAMIHHGLLIHGAAANRGDRPRRAYALTLFPADARYTGLPHIATDHLGLTSQATFDHPDFPMIY
jgi:hypothetical protein